MKASIADRLIKRSQWDGDCLRWTGDHNRQGYGRIHIEGQKRSVHRVAYAEWIAPIPDGMEIDHVKARGCRFRDCLNPAHLEAVTKEQNNARRLAAHTHCPQGHRYVAENILWSRGGTVRNCRTCRSEIRQCGCGGSFSRQNRHRHVRTQKHQSWAAGQGVA